MKYLLFKKMVLLGGVFLAMSSYAQMDTGKIRINGFASLVGGMTLNQGQARDGFDPTNTDSVYQSSDITEGVYDEDLSFRPDTNFGLQITANLGGGISAIGQVTGDGGEDFDAQIAWAYIRYDFNDNWQMKLGRQRLPYFFYSDFLDVGYAYHWIRPDPNLAANIVDTLDGVSFRWSTTSGNVDWTAEVFGGNSVEEFGTLDILIDIEKTYGTVLKVSNDWLQLRGSWSYAETNDGGSFTSFGEVLGTDKNPLPYEFYGLGVQFTLGNTTIVSEYTGIDIDGVVGADGIPGVSPFGGVVGISEGVAWYVSAAFRLGDFTPHITYAEEVQDNIQNSPGQTVIPVIVNAEQANASVTLGLRWDFHPSAAFKVEYITVSDESDDFRKNSFGPFGIGFGDSQEVDLFAFGFDVIF